jgi:hypothetical protein
MGGIPGAGASDGIWAGFRAVGDGAVDVCRIGLAELEVTANFAPALLESKASAYGTTTT